MFYVFMVLTALSTVIMSYEITLNAQSFLATFFICASIICWALSALSIMHEFQFVHKQVKELQKKIEELEKRYDDKNG